MCPFHSAILSQSCLSELAEFKMNARLYLHQTETRQVRLHADDVSSRVNTLACQQSAQMAFPTGSSQLRSRDEEDQASY